MHSTLLRACLFSLVGLAALRSEPGHKFPAIKPEEVAYIEAALPAHAPAVPKAKHRILIFYRTEGYVHASIPYANLALTRMGEKTGAYEADVSDDMAVFTPENLRRYDLVLFNSTTGLAFADPAQRKALMDRLKDGAGLAGIHAATDNFRTWPEAQQLIGGVFHNHPWTAADTEAVKVDDPASPIVASFKGKGFWIRDEIYEITETYGRDKQHVVLSLDMSKPANARKGKVFRTDNDFPISWIKKSPDGVRVFYSSLGHNPNIFWVPEVLQHYLAGIQYALGDLDADATPSAQLNPPPPPALAPDTAQALQDRMPVVQAGWKIESILSAPQLLNPSVVCAAPDGRIFIAQDPVDMAAPSDSPSDSILCLYPDGKITTFAEGLHAVFGLAYLDGKLYVHHTPYFTVFTDDHGVGRARRDLFRTNPNPNLDGKGFNDHIPSNLRLAMDGWFYMTTGDKGIYRAEAKDGSRAEIHGGGILRFRPDGTQLEVYTTGTRNHLDVAINSEDEMFTYDNTDDGMGWWTRVTHMVDAGFYGYPFDYKPRRPYTLWKMTDYGGGSPTGAVAYNEDALPAEYRGNLFLCDWGRGQLLRLQVSRTGATYQIDRRVQTDGLDFVADLGKTFNPVGLAISPDGMSFYIADWNCWAWKQELKVGRLLKATYMGPSEAAPKPTWWVAAATAQPFEASDSELVAALSHPAESVRLVAQHRLAERGAAAVPLLKALLADAGAAEHARWHAIWALDAIDGGVAARGELIGAAAGRSADSASSAPGQSAEALAQAEGRAPPSVRAQAIRALGTERAREAAGALASCLSDPQATIRFRAATALGRIADPASVPALMAALSEKDFYTRYAIFTALRKIGTAVPSTWPAIAAGLNSDDAWIREGASFAMRETYVPENASALAAFVASSADASERSGALEILAELHRERPAWDGKWWGTQPVASPPPAKTVDWAGTPIVLSAIEKALKDPDSGLRQFAVKAALVARDSAAAPQLRALFPRETEETKLDILRALGALKDHDAADLVAQQITQGRLLAAAVPAAGEIGGDRCVAALVALAEATPEDEILLPTLAALTATKSPAAAEAFGDNLGSAALNWQLNPKVVTAAAEGLAAIGGDAAMNVVLKELESRDEVRCRGAIQAAGLLKDPRAVPVLVRRYANPELRFDAATALAAIADPRAVDVYLDALATDLKAPAPETAPSFNPLPDHIALALQTIRSEALPAIEKRQREQPFTGQALGRLQQVYWHDAKAKAGPLFAGESKPADTADYDKFAEREPGDAAKGAAIFGSMVCVSCHRVNGQGAQIGPDLSDIGAKYGRSFLIESVLYPSKQIQDGYHTNVVTTKSGETVAGFLRSETEDDVVIIDVGGGRHTIAKNQITKREELPISFMPEGLQSTLSLADFADLIAYLQSLKGGK